MLKRAFSKLKLEHVVIGKGQFKAERTKNDSMEVSYYFFLLYCCVDDFSILRKKKLGL